MCFSPVWITAFNNSLSNFKGTVLLSTNDRAFAESVANRIIEITPNGIIDSYLPFSEYIVDEKIINQREKRIRPGLDDKSLTSWNGLMLKGYVDAYMTFTNDKHLDIALKNANFIVSRLNNFFNV